jgi:hypothetical protein
MGAKIVELFIVFFFFAPKSISSHIAVILDQMVATPHTASKSEWDHYYLKIP